MATLTITTTGSDDPRIAAAFGRHLALPGNATLSQIRADIAAYIRRVVREQERDQAMQALTDNPDVGAS